MFRVFTRPKGAPINDPRIGQPMWSKPGTPMDRVAKRARYERFKAAITSSHVFPKVHHNRREIERRLRQMPDDGLGRVRVARAVTGMSSVFAD